ncbi:MAG TPA: hypothetical protein PKL97_01245 [Candidatus Omnitrophota bacterium]|nr:hypothetical protein [Candidatus Omnitrophota bacterium]
MVKKEAPQERVFFLAGDPFLREKKLLEIIRNVSEETPEIRNYYPSDFDLPKFIEDATSYSLFSPRKVLVVKDVSELSSREKERIAAALTGISLQNIIVFETDEFPRRDSRSASGKGEDKGSDVFFEWIRFYGKSFSLQASREEMASYAKGLLKQKGHEISGEALEFLLERSGGSFRLLAGALEKLSLRARKEAVSPEEVLSLSENGQTFNTFDLVHAFNERKISKALGILSRLFEEAGSRKEEAALGIMGALNYGLKERWKRIGRSPLQDRNARDAEKRLKTAVEDLFRLNWGMKRGSVDIRQGLESFLVKFG